MTLSNIKYKKVTLSNGETIAYQERDGGEHKVLLIHGNMTSSKHWDLILEQMDSKFKIYAVDMRGFGQSSYHQRIQSIKDFSDDIKGVVDAIGLNDFSIIGWSTGGAVGMQFVADYPGYCSKLVLLASASTRGYPFYGVNENGQPDFTKRLSTYEQIKIDPIRSIPIQHAYHTKNYPFLQEVWNATVYTKNRPNEDKYREYVEDMLTQRNLAEVYHSLNTFNISNKHNGLIEGNGLAGNIKLPVLVLRGDRDFVITERMAQEIVEDIGNNARFVELKDCGHSPLIDDLDQLLGVISEFLE